MSNIDPGLTTENKCVVRESFYVGIVDNTLSEQDERDIKEYLNEAHLIDIWLFENSLFQTPFTLRKLLLELSDYKLFTYNSEVISQIMTSFSSNDSKKFFLIQTDIKLVINHCNLMEFIDSLQLLFNPEVTQLSFSSKEGDLSNCFLYMKLDVDK